MDEQKLKMIYDLMGELVGDMEPDADDFNDRLGKPKPEMGDDMSAMPPDEGDMGGKMPMGGDEDMPMNEDDKLKERLMKMKG